MNNFINDYIDFISWYDPYFGDDAPENEEDAIYNLQEIKKELDSNADNDADLLEAKHRIAALLEKYNLMEV